ncbi:uncharacterized protein METZ01_LOCUS455395, partial [marine metagenome]
MNLINNIITTIIPFLPKKIVKIIADKYVAGQTPKEALNVIKYLNLKKYDTTIDLLGEHIKNIKETEQITN